MGLSCCKKDDAASYWEVSALWQAPLTRTQAFVQLHLPLQLVQLVVQFMSPDAEYLDFALPRMTTRARESTLLRVLLNDDLDLATWIVRRFPEHRQQAINYAFLSGNLLALQRFAWDQPIDWTSGLRYAALGGRRRELMALCLDHGADPRLAAGSRIWLLRDRLDFSSVF
jgi:hypothetical protein